MNESHPHPDSDNRDSLGDTLRRRLTPNRIDGTWDGRESNFVFLFSVFEYIDKLPGL
jgi:hypothetical protein